MRRLTRCPSVQLSSTCVLRANEAHYLLMTIRLRGLRGQSNGPTFHPLINEKKYQIIIIIYFASSITLENICVFWPKKAERQKDYICKLLSELSPSMYMFDCTVSTIYLKCCNFNTFCISESACVIEMSACTIVHIVH
jgi:hypothetical protein